MKVHGGWCKNKIGFIIKPLSLSAVNEDTPPKFLSSKKEDSGKSYK